MALRATQQTPVAEGATGSVAPPRAAPSGRAVTGRLTFKTLSFLGGFAYHLLAWVLVLAAAVVLVASLLNDRDYRDLLIDVVQKIAPDLDAGHLNLSLFRSNARITAGAIRWPGLSVRTFQLGVGWRQLFGFYMADQPLAGIQMTLQGVEVAVQEDMAGAWSMVGLARGDETGMRDGFDWKDWQLVWGHLDYLAVEDSRIRVRTADGAEHVIALESMRMQRDASDRIRASLRLTAVENAPSAVIHALFDPSRLSASVSVHALSLPRFRSVGIGAVGALDDINLLAGVRYQERRRWRANLGPSSVSQNGQRLRVAGGQVNRHDDVLHIATRYLDIQAIGAFLLDGQWLPASAHEALETMQPAGSMHGVHVIVPIGDASMERARLFADLKDVAMSPWGIVPGVSGFNGMLNIGATDGSLHFVSTSASIAMPVLYDDPLGPYAKLQGAIHWEVDERRRLHMRADPLIIEQVDGGVGRLMISAEAALANTAAAQIRLMAGWRDIDIEDALGYIPKVVDRQLRGWLDDVLVGGLLSVGGLTYRATVGAGAKAGSDLQVYVEMRDGVVALAPGLPVAEHVNGKLTLDNDDAYFNLDSFQAGSEHWTANGPVHGYANTDSVPSSFRGPATQRYEIAVHNMALTLPLLNEHLQHMSLFIDGDGAQWNIAVRHPGIKARITVPAHPQLPSLVEVSRLAIQELNLSTDTVSSDEPPDINGWPNLDVDIQSLRIGKNNLGPIYFQMRSSTNKLSFRNVHAYFGGMEITGMDNGYGDHMTWVRSAVGHHSELGVRVRFGDLGPLLASFDLPPYLQSRLGHVEARLHWGDHIAAVTPAGLNGAVTFRLEKGLLEADEKSSGLLRAISALDLNRWLVQTLKRETSLHSKTGIAYDRIEGAVTLKKGRAVIQDRILLENPSTDIALSGQANLRTGALNGSVAATLPAVENLGWLATLGGLGAPVIVATHFLSRLFGRQLARFATSSYRVNGTWKDPEIRLENVFDGKE